MSRFALLLVALMCALAVVRADVFSATGDDPASLQDDIDDFKALLGQQNPFTPQTFTSGFRAVNWDAAPDTVAEPNEFPSDFFNADVEPRARGIEFFVPDDNDVLFISSTAASGTAVRFGDDDFRAFTEERIFGVRNNGNGDVYGEIFVYFFMPDAQAEHGWSRGFSAVFTGVEDDDSSLTFYDHAHEVIETVQVERNPDGFSFAGYVSDSANVFSVKIVTGNSGDFVAIDDVFFGEPQRHSDVTIYNHAGFDPLSINGVVETFRTDVGTLNAFDAQCRSTGRRQIDWDAAPETVSDPDDFPGDFFNFDTSPRARGIEFSSSNNDFLLSATAAEELAGRGDVLFGRSGTFQAFSPERVFTPNGDDEVNVHFFEPCDQDSAAKSSALGVVFVNVKGSESTVMEIFTDDDNDADWVLPVLPQALNDGGGLSFTGIVFKNNQAEIKSAHIQLPTAAFDSSSRAVVMDDFIFGEPRGFQSATAGTVSASFSPSDSSSSASRLTGAFVCAMLAALMILV